MKRQTRPFVVEIKSSHKPAQKAAPSLTDTAQTASASPDLWSGDLVERDTVRAPASLAALEEANRLFSAPRTPAPVLTQDVDLLPSLPAEVQGRSGGSSIVETGTEAPRNLQRPEQRGTILPDLSAQNVRGEGAQPQNADQRTTARKQCRPQRAQLGDAQAEDVEDQSTPAPASTTTSEPVVDTTSMPDQPEAASAPRSPARATPPHVSSAQQRGSVRALDQSWAFRVACRKAKRRGKPLPLRPAVGQKHR